MTPRAWTPRAAPVVVAATGGGRGDARRIQSSLGTSTSRRAPTRSLERRRGGRRGVQTPSAMDVDGVDVVGSSSFATREAMVVTEPYAPYAPSAMDATQATQQLVVLGAIALVTAYWWFVLVPSARERLARNKRTGALRSYLEELAGDASDGRRAEKWFYGEWLSKIDPETRYLLRDDVASGDEDDSSSSTTTGGVKLEDTEGGGRLGREPTIEEVVAAARKTPKFWSLDNPVLVGAALTIGLAAAFSGGVAP